MWIFAVKQIATFETHHGAIFEHKNINTPFQSFWKHPLIFENDSHIFVTPPTLTKINSATFETSSAHFGSLKYGGVETWSMYVQYVQGI